MKTSGWSGPELLTARPKDKLRITEWAESKRVLTNAAIKGPYQPSMVPVLVPIMDVFADPDVETVVLCKSAQIGGTDAMLNVLGYFVDQEPSSIMLVLADEDTAIQEMSRRRVQPMFSDSPELIHLPDKDQWTKRELGFINGARLTFGWASSVARLASRPFRIVVCDEIDKQGYDITTNEGDAIGLAKERTNTFANRKIGLLSTPTLDTGRITRELESCDVIYDWHVPCAYCGQMQPLRWSLQYASSGCVDGKYRAEDGTWHPVGQVIWEKGRDATREQIEAAAYQCGECGERWNTVQKNQAVQNGHMVPRAEIPFHARKIGFHVNRLYSLFPGGRLENLVSDWIEAVLSGDIKKIQGFVNSSLAEPWKQIVIESSEGAILKARVDLPSQTVPEEAVLLTCGIDNQLYGRWYVVRAWAQDYTSWLIDYGFLASWQELESLLFEATYPSISGKNLSIWRAGIDTGGGAQEDIGISMTEEVYWWIRKHRGRAPHIWPTKGASHPMPDKLKAGKPIEKTPSGKPIPGGLQIVTIDTGQMKEVYHYRLKKALDGDGEPQAAYLHGEVGNDYAKQISAEEKQIDRKGIEQWVQIRRDNHLLDCFDDKTEILTGNGWKSVKNISMNDCVATVNLEANKIEYHRPTDTIKRRHYGKMIEIKGRRIDILVTPNHRMVVATKRFSRKLGKHYYTSNQIKLAQDLTIWDKIKLTADWDGNEYDFIKINGNHFLNQKKFNDHLYVDAGDWAEFLGWYVSEGHKMNAVGKNKNRKVVISQSNELHHPDIISLLNGMPFKWHLSDGRQFVITDSRVYEALNNVPMYCHGKRVPNWIKTASKRIMLRFLDSAIKGDGWVQNGHRMYATTSIGLADDIQELFIKTGRAGNIKTLNNLPPCRLRGKIYQTRTRYDVSECKTECASLRDGRNAKNFNEIDFEGYVYCVTVPNGAMVCRRNGKSFIAGNCEVIAHTLVDPEWPSGGLNLYRKPQNQENRRPQQGGRPGAGWLGKRSGWMSKR